MDEDDDVDQHERPTRAERRAIGDRSASIAHRLLALDAAQAANLPLSDDLRELLDETRAMPASKARRRNERLLAQVIRDEDDMPTLEDALAAFAVRQASTARVFKHTERWRDLLVEGAVQTGEIPGGDTAKLGPLVEDARRERTTGKPRGSGRALFRALVDHFGAAPPPPPR